MYSVITRNTSTTSKVPSKELTTSAMTTQQQGNNSNLETTLPTSSSSVVTTPSTASITTNNMNVGMSGTCTFPEDYYQSTLPLQNATTQAQQQQQYQKHNNYYHPPPAATGLATFNGNSNLENVSANGSLCNNNSNNTAMHNNNNNNIKVNYNNGNSNIPTFSNKINHTTATSTLSSTSSSSSPVVIGKTDAAAASSTSTSTTNSILSGSGSIAPVPVSGHNHHLHHHNPPPVVYSGGQTMMANGGGNSGSNNSSNSQHNLNSILKGSKENLLQNNYSNGSIGGSTTGSETGGGTNGSGAGANTGNMSEQDDPGDGLGPLPPKWETAYTERGELYFIDHNTGTSHWLDPRLSKFQKKSLEECTEGELPYGWEKIEDSLYEAKRRAAEQKQNQHQQHLQQQAQQRPQTPSSSSVLNGTVASIGLSSVSSASTLSTVDISQRAMQPPPPMVAQQMSTQNSNKAMLPYKFTRNPAEMQGERITATLLKSARGLGITIVGGDGDGLEEFLQIKSIVPNGPAWVDGRLQMGDVLVYVNDTCVLGFTHHEMVNVFQSIMVGDTVTLEVCRGYPLPFDPNDPNTEVVTTIAVDGISNESEKQRRMLMDINMDGNYNFLDISGGSGGNNGPKHNLSTGSVIDNSGFILMKKPEIHTFSIVKGAMGFGFTIADSSYGQKVKKILDRSCCNQLQEGDILLEINDNVVRNKSHLDVVQILKDCSKTEPTLVKIQRPVNNTSAKTTSPNGAVGQSGAGSVSKLRKNFLGGTTSIGNNALFRSKTPTADLYSTMQKEVLPIRPKTPLVDTRRARVKTPNMELNEDNEVAAVNTSAEESKERSLAESKNQLNEGSKSQNSLSELDAINQDIPFMDPYPKMVSSLSERLANVTMQQTDASLQHPIHGHGNTGFLRTTASGVPNYENQSDYVSGGSGNYSSIYGLAQMPPTMSPLSGGLYGPPSGNSPGGVPNLGLMAPPSANSYHNHHESCFCYECQDFRNSRLNSHHPHPHHSQQQPSPRSFYPGVGYHPPPTHNHTQSQYSPASSSSLQAVHMQNERMQKLLNDRRRVGFSPLDNHHNSVSSYSPSSQQHPMGQHPHSLMAQQQQQQQHFPISDIPGISNQQPIGNWPNQQGGYNVLPTSSGIGMHNGGGYPESSDIIDGSGEQCILSEITLQRQALGFGFRIVGGTEEGSQVTVGHIVPGGAADNDHRITTGDEILSIDGINVVNSSHHKVVSLMGEAALRGQVTMILRRRTRPGLSQQQQQYQSATAVIQPHHQMMMPSQGGMYHQDLLQNSTQQQHHIRPNPVRYPYDVIVTRHENEGFGFVIISSSNQYYGSTIGKLIPSSPADRCGELKVGDRIIAVNRIDIAGMSHGDVVNLIKESGLHVRLTIGCPKEGAIIMQAPTMPAGSNTSNSGLLLNSAQASPGQVSQTPPTSNLQSNMDNNTPYFERPLLSAGSNNGSAASSSTHMSVAQQSPNALPIPPQL
ncbi:membrane associated guanylate kinase, WW and PDZ domain containing protein magi isoform X2 [Haematobia irritans]|uniref:membrane associated guanylate kinase, WW and PDZ domain containing protein magi isoform X2 n=1 Tax=Haematobia irritans TaxID=7368 RepID=UPI003F4FF854